MRHYVLKQTILLLFLFLSITLSAQNISVTDFKLAEQDLTANQQGTIVLDQNGEKCALIKVRTTQTGFNFDAGSLGVSKVLQKTAEIWVYVPYGVRKLTISHQKYGTLEYSIPVAVQKAKTYIMDLKAETPLPVDHQRLTIKCQPKNTVVSIDGEMVDIANGTGEMTLKLGTHKYLAMANGYYQMDGTFNLVAERPGRLSIDLEPKEGTVVASSTVGESLSAQPVVDALANAPDVMPITVNGVTFDMIKVTGGTFTMGATAEQASEANKDEFPTHQVTLNSYYIGKYEVTQALWKAVMSKNPSHRKGDNLPVEKVRWNDCMDFINRLNSVTGKKFRLPTEAEWEYACIGGNKSQGYKYSGSNNIDDVAWYYGTKPRKTHEVGTKQPNELGIYDMSGNVWEWCSDWYGSYSSSSQTNPTGALIGSLRVIRGGSWDILARHCRSSNRLYNSPVFSNIYLGLRLVLSE